MRPNHYFKLAVIHILFTLPLFAGAQQKWDIQGTVFDFFNKQRVEAVSVFSKSGSVAITDSLGRYSIPVRSGDSIWFSYLNKNTMKFSVDTIVNISSFDIGLHIDARYLPEVRVRNKNYKEDSVQNRKDYAKIFNFKKPGIALSSNPPSTYTPGSLTVGLDLDEFINMFRFRRNKRIEALQKRLLEEEQDKYITHRFTKRFVRQLTGLDSTNLDEFINYFKPDYDILLTMNDMELGYYIQLCYQQYVELKKQGLPLYNRRLMNKFRKPDGKELDIILPY
ncbi:hypothetical protein SAMN05421788_1011177 [Filimonas lacunae]|uniref:CarboxypepD_reg-like domain-containing protein n=1 Tax=Filimonas lacunae TaxID=477680 RepID=A0A173MQ03_9BACT|nr:hypothetical protein [Filimonas lacunae]BAV09743.1 hypothetical protein FLA_5796 [Filimonas lacunae]SIS78270.1 hypothetical protein SAMN05421788_1011177 [Filimonas lacunae]